MDFLARKYIKLDANVNRPEDAIRESGELLASAGDVTTEYVDQMIANFHQHGPYFVIAPHIAMPHARPEDGVQRSSISLVRLKEPVVFGHKSNDPVQLVIGLAASSSNDHLELLQKISVLLSNRTTKERILTASSLDQMEEIIKENVK